MCGDYVFGGDIEHPYVTGRNQYKLWTRSDCFEGFYCLVLLFAVGTAVVIWLSIVSLGNCYDSNLVLVILAHIIKPFVIAVFINCIPNKPIVCAVLRLSPMFFMDVPYAVFVMIFSWFPLSQCIIDEDLEIDTLILFILLSCLIIHLIFPLMATLRLIEVIVFERRVKRLRENHRERNPQRYMHEVEVPPIHDEQKEEKEETLTDLTALSSTDYVIGSSQQIAISRNDIDNAMLENIDEDESRDQFDETFIYGNRNNEPNTSLSNIFAASTKFISSGLFNKWNEEDICIICYDNFEKGKLCAKLNCGHFFHRDCCKQWLNESATCPLCRMGVSKRAFL